MIASALAPREGSRVASYTRGRARGLAERERAQTRRRLADPFMRPYGPTPSPMTR